MKIIFSLPLLIFLCMTTYTKVLIAEDFLLRDGDGNTVSFGKGTLGLRQKSGSQGNTSVQDLQGLQGLESLRSLGGLKAESRRSNTKPPSRCITTVKTGTSFNPREHRYGSDVLIQGQHSITVKNYYFSKSVIIDGNVGHSGTAAFIIDEHLLVHGDLLNQGTGDIEVADDLVITGNVENRGTGNIRVEGTIYKISGAKLLNQGTGSISGPVTTLDSVEQITCK